MKFDISALEHKVKTDPILQHPFLINLANGIYDSEQIKIWVSQQFYFSNQFPRCLGVLWSRITDYEVSLPLMKFLAVEHWGSEETGAHWKLYRQVLDFFGMSISDLKNIEPLEETKEYLDYRFNLCLNATVEEGLGCMGFAHELVNERIFDSYYQGMKRVPNISESALVYFKSHIEDEPEDYQIFKKIIQDYVKSEKSFLLVEQGAIETLRHRNNFFDKIKSRIDEAELQPLT